MQGLKTRAKHSVIASYYHHNTISPSTVLFRREIPQRTFWLHKKALGCTRHPKFWFPQCSLWTFVFFTLLCKPAEARQSSSTRRSLPDMGNKSVQSLKMRLSFYPTIVHRRMYP